MTRASIDVPDGFLEEGASCQARGRALGDGDARSRSRSTSPLSGLSATNETSTSSAHSVRPFDFERHMARDAERAMFHRLFRRFASFFI